MLLRCNQVLDCTGLWSEPRSGLSSRRSEFRLVSACFDELEQPIDVFRTLIMSRLLVG